MTNRQEYLENRAKAAIQIIAAVGDAIKKLGSVPSGHLYAQLMGNLDLNSYQTIIDTLKSTGLVKEDGFHLLTWIGPKE